jgi:hypothetical protein
MIRVEFDSTLDEIVDVNLRLASSTQTARRQRLWSQVSAGGCLWLAVVVTLLMNGARLSDNITAIFIAVGAVAGALFGYLYGYFHDWYMRDQYRRLLAEMFRGVDPIRCEVELRPDVLWCRTAVSETSLPWSRLKQVNDAGHGVELWFDPGLAIIRPRAFARAEDRRDFLDAVGRLRDAALVQ